MMFSTKIKVYSKYMETILAPNGFQGPTSGLDINKWKHYPGNDNVAFSLFAKDNCIVVKLVLQHSFTLEEISFPINDSTNTIQFTEMAPALSVKYLGFQNENRVMNRFQVVFNTVEDFERVSSILKYLKCAIKIAKTTGQYKPIERPIQQIISSNLNNEVSLNQGRTAWDNNDTQSNLNLYNNNVMGNNLDFHSEKRRDTIGIIETQLQDSQYFSEYSGENIGNYFDKMNVNLNNSPGSIKAFATNNTTIDKKNLLAKYSGAEIDYSLNNATTGIYRKKPLLQENNSPSQENNMTLAHAKSQTAKSASNIEIDNSQVSNKLDRDILLEGSNKAMLNSTYNFKISEDRGITKDYNKTTSANEKNVVKNCPDNESGNSDNILQNNLDKENIQKGIDEIDSSYLDNSKTSTNLPIEQKGAALRDIRISKVLIKRKLGDEKFNRWVRKDIFFEITVYFY
ncbi:hypothetical protein Kpol_1041p22 [Vanderwaltozyma polyspora DSM 70294]|uniref:Uncharacterized protein n=1 Tax=Vanderwaltozyma polyspora (strain ATCC 22028 / DSM 70294 / BCRC 21397 / CBS 2163 / NBRC 10782 / NRRL Y-8283 / UCD 57-17) TaxID=436907 RepID=A7TL89_VANPO|nr:uncharacterized protein Kpol_1041p22 [Vanderwaltozyma polyspora DSM 70294]EDO16964.1 hypothetical protein Kpol_1041p22 [Vanderwaltozyma polyspora DSM 70294]